MNENKNKQLLMINGYIIDELTGRLVAVPEGLKFYQIPREVKELDPTLNLLDNEVLKNFLNAEVIDFTESSISKIPSNYFTFASSKYSKIKRIYLPKNIKELEDDCIDMTTVECDFPSTLEYLGRNMYPEVQKLIIGDNIKKLGNLFASHDTNLVEVEVAGSVRELPKYFVNQCKNIKKIILHEGVEIAGDDAFRGLNNLVYIELPESFKTPFKTTMDYRPVSNKRGNSKYDPNFEGEKNNILTIRKIYNGIPYTFEVRRRDFSEISFQNGVAKIKPSNPQLRSMELDLNKWNSAAICQVDLQNSTIMQKFSTATSSQSEQNVNFTDEQILNQFKKINSEVIEPSAIFNSIQDDKLKIRACQILYNIFYREVKTQKTLDINKTTLYNTYEKIVQKLNQMYGTNFNAQKPSSPVSDFTDGQILNQFKKIYNEVIEPSNIFNNIKDNTQKMRAWQILYNMFYQTVKTQKSFNIDRNAFYDNYKEIVEEIQQSIKYKLNNKTQFDDFSDVMRKTKRRQRIKFIFGSALGYAVLGPAGMIGTGIVMGILTKIKLKKLKLTQESYVGKITAIQTEESKIIEEENNNLKEELELLEKDHEYYKIYRSRLKYKNQVKLLEQIIAGRENVKKTDGSITSNQLKILALKFELQKAKKNLKYVDKIIKRHGLIESIGEEKIGDNKFNNLMLKNLTIGNKYLQLRNIPKKVKLMIEDFDIKKILKHKEEESAFGNELDDAVKLR